MKVVSIKEDLFACNTICSKMLNLIVLQRDIIIKKVNTVNKILPLTSFSIFASISSCTFVTVK